MGIGGNEEVVYLTTEVSAVLFDCLFVSFKKVYLPITTREATYPRPIGIAVAYQPK